MVGGSWGLLATCIVSGRSYVDILSTRYIRVRSHMPELLINGNTHARERSSSLARLGSGARVPSELWHVLSRACECAARAAQASGAIQLLLRKRLPRSPTASSKQLELLARSMLLEGGGGAATAADVVPSSKDMRAAARKCGACIHGQAGQACGTVVAHGDE